MHGWIDADRAEVVVRRRWLALLSDLIVESNALGQAGSHLLEGVPVFCHRTWPGWPRSGVSHRGPMYAGFAPRQKDWHIESDACSHQQREELRHTLSVVRAGLKEKSRDRILCERCGQAAHRLIQIGLVSSGDLHDA